ncbi:MAG: hypothetical protein ACLPY5_12165 [Candidatus Bathyarchaeia archaeon]
MRRPLSGRRSVPTPTWQDWVTNASLCEQSLTYFEGKAQVKILNPTQAREDILGHLRKAFHNLTLANQIFDATQKNQLTLKYPGENFYDWTVTISYYAMYQAALAALAAVRKAGENHTATVCALIYHYVHKKKRLHERYLLSIDTIKTLADQDVQKLIEKRFQREQASYDTSITTELGIANSALTDAREFVLAIRAILEDGLGKDFLRDV